MTDRPLRIAICCHSVNPRGGVAHGLALGEALAALGHEPVVHAPDPDGRGFFRGADVETAAFPATPVEPGDVVELVGARTADYARHFDDRRVRGFDLFHAQDGLSGNALASLMEQKRIRRFARTVHHVDTFSDPRLVALQRRAIVSADAHFVVSRMWREALRLDEDLDATIVGNGVDGRRFSPIADGRETALRARFGLDGAPLVLAVGGIEERKNSLRLLGAFAQIRFLQPRAQLVIAGGASLLDHDAYRTRFEAMLRELALPPDAVVITGPVPDDDMPALYRIADVLAFPSLREGFGLAGLEAMASGTPVVAPSIAPFTEYLGPQDVAWCDPSSEGSIANAILASLAGPLRGRLSRRGLETAARHSWSRTAGAHLGVYRRLSETAYA